MGEMGEMRGNWRTIGHSTQDVGCGGFWRHGTKLGEKWDEIPVFHSPILPIFLEVKVIPHSYICKSPRTHQRKNGNCCHSRTLTANSG